MKDDIYDTSTITQQIANKFAQSLDKQVAAMLEKNGIKWTGNIADMQQQLKEKGYRLESEVERGFDKSTHTFYLTKIIDKRVVETNFRMEIG